MYTTKQLLTSIWWIQGFIKPQIDTFVPAKSNSDFMFVYKVIRDLESIDYLCINHIHKITSDLSIRVSSNEVNTLVFYLAIVNKVLRHRHSWLAR